MSLAKKKDRRPAVPIAREITPQRLEEIAQRVSNLLPEEDIEGMLGTGGLEPQEYAEQVRDLTLFAIDYEDKVEKQNNGNLLPSDQKPITFADILNATPKRKIESGTQLIREILAPLVLREDLTLDKYRNKFARNIRELQDWLGSKKRLAEAINGLSEFERALFFSLSSVSLAEDLGFADLDTCSEQRLSCYIRNVVFRPDLPLMKKLEGLDEAEPLVNSEQIDELETLMCACIERDERSLNLCAVIDNLCEPPYAGYIFRRLEEIACKGSFLDLIVIFFRNHEATRHLAASIEDKYFH